MLHVQKHTGCTCNPKLHEQVPVVAHAAEFLFSWEVTAFAQAKLVLAPRASLNNCDQECKKYVILDKNVIQFNYILPPFQNIVDFF